MDWTETRDGSRWGRYEIELLAPNDWGLSVKGRLRSHHHTASSARATVVRLEGQRRRRSALLFHGGLFVAVAIALLVVLPLRRNVNPAYGPAVDLTSEMQAAFEISAGGMLSPESSAAFSLFDSAIVVGDGVSPESSAAFSLFESTVVVGDGVEIQVLIGTAGNECYVMYWAPDTQPRAGALVSALDCEPQAILATSIEANYTRFTPAISRHLMRAPSRFKWNQVLPSPTKLPVWYFPAVIGLAALLLRSFISLTVAFLPGSPEQSRP